MDKLLLALGHDTSGKLIALKRAVDIIKQEYLTEENKSNIDFMILLDNIKVTLEILQVVLDEYDLNRKSVSQNS